MRTLQKISLQNLGIAAALALGLTVAACDEEGGTTDEQLGAVPGAPDEMSPAPEAQPEPMIEEAPDEQVQ